MNQRQILLCLAFSMATITTLFAADSTLSLKPDRTTVGLYNKIEFALSGIGDYPNPFDPDQVSVDLLITGPNNTHLSVPAFWSQPYATDSDPHASRDWFYPHGLPGWFARFAPSQTGHYEAAICVHDNTGQRQSAPVTFDCITSPNRGYVRVSQRDPRFLEFSQGQPFFPIGQNLAFIGDSQYITFSKTQRALQSLAENGANYLRIWTCCDDWATAIEARKSAWGRSWNWTPPFVKSPEDPNLKIAELTATKRSVEINPSHRVALRPSATYTLSARIRTENARLRIEATQLTQTVDTSNSWQTVTTSFTSGPNDYWLGNLRLSLEGEGRGWLSAISLKENNDGPDLLWETEINRPARVFYNQPDAFVLDRTIENAEKLGMYLQLCLLTRDLYMSALKNPSSTEYARAVADAKKFFRYAIARWGYSTSVAAWEYWNEMDPGLPTEQFYQQMGEFFETADPWHHLRMTSTWGPSAKDAKHPKLDFADVHFYLRPSDHPRISNEVQAVLDRAHWLREQAPSKPAHLGEFGVADEKWGLTEEAKSSPETIDCHNALWASALTQITGTAMFWWWERLDQRNFYPQYKPLSAFISDVPWTSGTVKAVETELTGAAVTVIGLRAENRSWIWLFNPEASWRKVVVEKKSPAPVKTARLKLNNCAVGSYSIEWWDTRTGSIIQKQTAQSGAGSLALPVPEFSSDIALKTRLIEP